jgi:hypothetical protein
MTVARRGLVVIPIVKALTMGIQRLGRTQLVKATRSNLEETTKTHPPRTRNAFPRGYSLGLRCRDVKYLVYE